MHSTQAGQNGGDGLITEPGTIVFQRRLPGPIERVWAYLTESEKRGKWLARGAMELVVGGKVTLEFHHAELSTVAAPAPEKYRSMKNGASLNGRITRLDPPRLLAYTWPDGSGQDSEVTFELSTEGSDVHLLLTHRRLKGHDALVSVAAGWHTHLGILADHLHDRAPHPFWPVHTQLEEHYARRIELDEQAE